MTEDTQEVEWNDLRVGDVEVRPNGDTRTVVEVTKMPGINWVSFDNGHKNVTGGPATIRARDRQ